jgi:DNA-binding transcriptional ArsR family regulator
MMNSHHDALLDALGDRTRRAILELLRSGPRPVVEIARELPVGRPAVSQHLKVLKDVGLVIDQAAGTRRVYQINPDGLAQLEDYARSFWSVALTRYQRSAQAVAERAKAGTTRPRR